MVRTDYHHGDLRAAVLNAAEEELHADPRKALSIRALAGKLGVSATAPHAHFKTKDDLLAALAVRGFERLRDQTLRRSETTTDPAAKLAALAEAYLEFSIENAGLYRIMFATGVDQQAYPELRSAARSSYAVLRAAVSDTVVDGPDRVLDQRTLAAWGVVHGFASLLSEGRIAEDLVPDRTPKGLARIAAKLIVVDAAANAGQPSPV